MNNLTASVTSPTAKQIQNNTISVFCHEGRSSSWHLGVELESLDRGLTLGHRTGGEVVIDQVE